MTTISKSGIIIPRVVFLDAAGSPLVGGLVQTLQAGTSTPATTYQDALGAEPNQNPITLDAFGSAIVWLDPNQLYDFVVADANNSLLYTIENVTGLPAVLGTAAVADVGTGNTQLPTMGDNKATFMLQGLNTISVPSASVVPCAVNPTGSAATYGGAFDTFIGVPYQAAVVQQAAFVVFMPKAWDPTQTIGVQVFWTVNGPQLGNVVWQLDAAAMSAGNASPLVSGATLTLQPSAAQGVPLQMSVTAQGQLPVIANAVKGCQVNFLLSRQGTNGGDTLAATALLRGIKLTYKVNAGDDS